jgi:hypothetical protein
VSDAGSLGLVAQEPRKRRAWWEGVSGFGGHEHELLVRIDVAVVDIDQAGAQEAAQQIEKAGGRVATGHRHDPSRGRRPYLPCLQLYECSREPEGPYQCPSHQGLPHPPGSWSSGECGAVSHTDDPNRAKRTVTSAVVAAQAAVDRFGRIDVLVTRPRHASIGELWVMPTDQA